MSAKAKLSGCWIDNNVPGTAKFYIYYPVTEAHASIAGKTVVKVRRASTGTSDEAEAEAALAQWVIKNRAATPSSNAEMQIGTLLQRHWEEHASKLDGAPANATNIATLIAKLGERPVSDLNDLEVIEDYKRQRVTDGYRIGTINRELGLLRTALNRSYKRRYLTERPPLIVAFTKDEEMEDCVQPDIFTAEQLRDLLHRSAAEADYMFRFILLMAATMCRPSAARDLTPSQVDLDAGLINLLPAHRRQNNKRRPVVKIAPCLRPYLVAWMKGLDAHTPFVNLDGKRLGSGRDMFLNIVKGDMRLRGKYCFYSIRHTMTTLLVAMGVDESVVSVHMGHTRKDVGKMTPTYIHKGAIYRSPSYLKQTTDGIDAILTKALAPVEDKKVVKLFA